MKKLTREEIEAERKVPAFQVANAEGVTDLKAARAEVFDALCDMALSSLEQQQQQEAVRVLKLLFEMWEKKRSGFDPGPIEYQFAVEDEVKAVLKSALPTPTDGGKP
jgi:hypothetical protein